MPTVFNFEFSDPTVMLTVKDVEGWISGLVQPFFVRN
jgi:hypothetical protein